MLVFAILKKNITMKYSISTLMVFLFIFNVSAQQRNISISSGVCFNGSGDTRGIIYSTEYSRYIKDSKFFWSASFGGTIHSGSFPIFYEYPQGRMNDGSVNYTIAGLQASFHVGKNFLKTKDKEFFFKIGPVIRYQSSSYWDRITVLYEPLTSIPFPLVLFENTTPRNTIAIGASPMIGYVFPVGKSCTFGIVGGFQFDTQGDNLSYLTLQIGKRF